VRTLVVFVLAAASACGRYGFDATSADPDAMATPGRPDSLARSDAGMSIDSPPGVGDYSVATGTDPFLPLAGQPVPGFAVKDDDKDYPIPLPFTFEYYGVPYTQATVNTNGFVTFGASVSAEAARLNACPLDATPPDAMIAVFWDDLYATDVAPMGSISYLLDGTAPDRRLTVEWRDLDAYYVAGGNAFTQGLRVTHQLVLHETGTIEMRYGPRTTPLYANKDCGADRHRGCSATVGLEAPASTMFKNVQCGTSAGPGPGYTPIDANRVITFTPQ
jgi:hypothetical protein